MRPCARAGHRGGGLGGAGGAHIPRRARALERAPPEGGRRALPQPAVVKVKVIPWLPFEG